MTISVVMQLFVIGSTACQTMAMKIAVSTQVSQMIEATTLLLSNIFHFKIINPPCLSLSISIREEMVFDVW